MPEYDGMYGALPDHYSVLKSGEVPEEGRMDYCKLPQQDRYVMAKALEGVRGKEGIVPALEVDKWCAEVRRRRRVRQAKDAGPQIKTVNGGVRIRKREPDYWGAAPDPWAPFLIGALVGLTFVFSLAFCLFFQYLDRHHFDPSYWYDIYLQFSWVKLYERFAGGSQAQSSRPSFF